MTEVEIVKCIFASINRKDTRSVLKDFHPESVRVEFEESPSGSTFRGAREIFEHFSKASETWTEGSCEPENIIVSGSKVVALVHVRVKLKNNSEWIEGRVAEVFTFQAGQVIEMRAFTDAQKALDWATESVSKS